MVGRPGLRTNRTRREAMLHSASQEPPSESETMPSIAPRRKAELTLRL